MKLQIKSPRKNVPIIADLTQLTQAEIRDEYRILFPEAAPQSAPIHSKVDKLVVRRPDESEILTLIIWPDGI